MKLPIINDTHAGARGDSLLFNDFFFRFWDGIFFPYLEEHKIKRVFHLGDFVDRRKFMNTAIVAYWRRNWVDRFVKMGIELDILVGNHDCPFKNTNHPNAIQQIFADTPGARVYADPTEINIEGVDIALVPWINDENRQTTLRMLGTTKAEIVFGHLELAGFEMERGNICQSNETPRSLFDRFDVVLSGHFHHRSTDGTIFYLGNAYEMTWADYNDPRGFTVFDTETREMEYVKNPNRIFHKVLYNDTNETYESLRDMDLGFAKDSIIKVIVGMKNNAYWFDFFLERLYKAGAYDVTIVEDFSGLDTYAANTANGEISTAEDTLTILDKSVDAIKEGMTLDSEKLKNVLRETYAEATMLETV